MAIVEEIVALERLALPHGLRVVQCRDGHLQVQGGSALVNWWPLSRRRTAHVEGGRSVPRASAELVIKLAMGDAEGQPLPQLKAASV